MQRYAFRDWDSVPASIGHGGLKEGQVINKMIEEMGDWTVSARCPGKTS